MIQDYVVMSSWGKDHWSLLAYIESVITDCGGFQVGADSRMRQCRRNFRVMSEECPSPRRPTTPGHGIPMDSKYGSRLKDGTSIPGHDDWHCVQDMANEGLFEESVDYVEPGEILHLSDKGRKLANKLREHKGNGGSFGNFVCNIAGHEVEKENLA